MKYKTALGNTESTITRINWFYGDANRNQLIHQSKQDILVVSCDLRQGQHQIIRQIKLN